jgi:hypothetical protein
MADHWKRNFDRIAFIPVVHWGHRLTLEETLIKKLKPLWNVQLVGGRLSEDRRCKAHGARGRDISGDRFATHRLLMNVAIEKTGTQKALAAILEVEPRAVSHWRRTGDIPAEQKLKVEAFVGMSVDAIATFIAESGAPDKWQKREYFTGDFEEEQAA